MFTISMGALALKVTLIIYGWMSTPVVLVTGGLILLVKINKIKQKYFQIIKYIYAQKLNKQGFIKTRFLVRKRKLLDMHRQILKTVLFITRISEVTFNLRKLPIYQVQYSNWNISYAYDQLSNSKTISTMGYSKIAHQIQKCGKASAKHIWEINQARYFGGKAKKFWVCIVTILKIVAYKYLDEITQATLLIIGGVHKNPGPITREKDQLQIITQNVRGMIEVKKKKLIINKCHELFKKNPSTINDCFLAPLFIYDHYLFVYHFIFV